MVFGFEKYLASVNPAFDGTGSDVIERHILLREHAQASQLSVFPTDEYLTNTDSLIRKEYRFEIDENGFIFPSNVHDNPETPIFLGGSTTETIYVDELNRFPYLVGR